MSAKNKVRYTGPPTPLYSYSDEFLVQCPKCDREARISMKGEPYSNKKNGILRCEHCLHSENTLSRIRYYLIVNRNCNNCGERIETRISDQKRRVKKKSLTCPACGVAETYSPKYEEYVTRYPDTGLVSDPAFNLPLWLQSDFKTHVFWALNRRHLEEIRSYVASDLRERRTLNYTTMVEKLPHFIKMAKNRAAILKMIGRLERKGID